MKATLTIRLACALIVAQVALLLAAWGQIWLYGYFTLEAWQGLLAVAAAYYGLFRKDPIR